jgi:ribosomal protein S18 acetylase RimI-like enzyme
MGTSPFSYKRCVVAVAGTQVVGHANYFEPTKKDRLTRYLMAELGITARLRLWSRLRRIRAFEKLRYDGSLCIDTMAVSPKYRRRGIGNGLIQIVKQKARRRALSYVSLRVWADNKVARRLYAKHGFKIVDSIDLSPRGPLAYKGRSLLMVSSV